MLYAPGPRWRAVGPQAYSRRPDQQCWMDWEPTAMGLADSRTPLYQPVVERLGERDLRPPRHSLAGRPPACCEVMLVGHPPAG